LLQEHAAALVAAADRARLAAQAEAAAAAAARAAAGERQRLARVRSLQSCSARHAGL